MDVSALDAKNPSNRTGGVPSSSFVVSAKSLFDSCRLGDIEVSNRIVMAPMERSRADPATNVAGPIMAEYYRQRATAGLIVTEVAPISALGRNYYRSAGIYTPAQIAGWRSVAEAVHSASGRIALQLVHAGRATHEDNCGGQPVAPSTLLANTRTYTASGASPPSMPRTLDREELLTIVQQFRDAARNAKDAGFDGVEIHAANGYLIDQFLKDGSNKRSDEYGGSIANRLRFLFEVLDSVLQVWPSGKIGIRISPSEVQGARDSEPQMLFGTLLGRINTYSLAYVHAVEGVPTLSNVDTQVDHSELRKIYQGNWIANNGYTFASASAAVLQNRADLVSFGRSFIANPDLVERFKTGAELASGDKKTFVGGDERGYTDYPMMRLT